MCSQNTPLLPPPAPWYFRHYISGAPSISHITQTEAFVQAAETAADRLAAVTPSSNTARRRKVLSLKFQGYEAQDIASILHMPVSTVQRYIEQAASAASDDTRANIVREAELAKLDEMESAFFPQAVEGDAGSASMVLKFMERRSKLIGADKEVKAAPSNVNVKVSLVGLLATMDSSVKKIAPQEPMKDITPPAQPVSRVAEDA